MNRLQQQKASSIPDHAPRINAQRAADAWLKNKLANNPHLNRQARACVDWLKAQGFTVLRVESGPRITVQPNPLCDQLEGAVAGYSRGVKGESRYHMVWRLNCQVQWEVPK